MQVSVLCFRWVPTNSVVNQFTLDRIHKFYLSCTNTLPLHVRMHVRTHAAQRRIHLIALSACKNFIAVPVFVFGEFGSVRSVGRRMEASHPATQMNCDAIKPTVINRTAQLVTHSHTHTHMHCSAGAQMFIKRNSCINIYTNNTLI